LKESIARINKFISEHPQKGHSKLYPIIQSVLECDLVNAKLVASKHCNILSLYALLYGMQFITMSYQEFFKFLLDNDFAKRDNGWISGTKENIFRELGISVKITELDYDEQLPDGFYQIKVSNEYGTHFMVAYKVDGKFYLSDTSFRGVGVLVSKATKNDKVEWVKRYEQD